MWAKQTVEKSLELRAAERIDTRVTEISNVLRTDLAKLENVHALVFDSSVLQETIAVQPPQWPAACKHLRRCTNLQVMTELFTDMCPDVGKAMLALLASKDPDALSKFGLRESLADIACRCARWLCEQSVVRSVPAQAAVAEFEITLLEDIVVTAMWKVESNWSVRGARITNPTKSLKLNLFDLLSECDGFQAKVKPFHDSPAAVYTLAKAKAAKGKKRKHGSSPRTPRKQKGAAPDGTPVSTTAAGGSLLEPPTSEPTEDILPDVFLE
eukprot:5894751-Amphidinium_carterae.6